MKPNRIGGAATGGALVVAVLALLVLMLAGCGSDRLSAQQAAQKIGRYLPRYHVECRSASGSFWDYTCMVTPPPGSKDKPYKVKVTVGPHEILEKAVCGARTGTYLNC